MCPSIAECFEFVEPALKEGFHKAAGICIVIIFDETYLLILALSVIF
jgi:hypothetical protein